MLNVTLFIQALCATICPISIVYRDNYYGACGTIFSGGYYQDDKKVCIITRPTISNDLLCVLIAHEVGHHWLCNQQDFIGSTIGMEEQAWDGGQLLLESVGFTNWRLFNTMKRFCLSTYKHSYGYNKWWRQYLRLQITY